MRLFGLVSAREHQRLLDAQAAATAENARLLGEARGSRHAAEQFLKRMGEDLNEARTEIRRLTDVIIELKRGGHEVARPVGQVWEPYTTAEADAARAAQLRDADPESHEQQPTTDGGPHTGYLERLELVQAARQALESEIQDL